MFNGTQPSDEGCNVSTGGALNINCGQGTTLIDCDRGFNGSDYSDLSNTFVWNKTTEVDQKLSIVFRFDQEIRINKIAMFFWNSQSNSIIVPNVRIYWSNDDLILPSKYIPAAIISTPNRTGDGQRTLDVSNITSLNLQFQYLRIEMSFYNNSEWIFLDEVQFCGK